MQDLRGPPATYDCEKAPSEVVLTEPNNTPPAAPPDRTLRRMLTWVAIALVVAVILAFIGVELALWLFDR